MSEHVVKVEAFERSDDLLNAIRTAMNAECDVVTLQYAGKPIYHVRKSHQECQHSWLDVTSWEQHGKGLASSICTKCSLYVVEAEQRSH